MKSLSGIFLPPFFCRILLAVLPNQQFLVVASIVAHSPSPKLSGFNRMKTRLFEEGELHRESVVAVFATTAAGRKTYQVEYYNQDVIISVGYRVKFHRSTQFRIWAHW